MKPNSIIYKIMALFFAIQSIVSFSQVPEKISYQSIIRDATGDLVKSRDVKIQISILQDSISGSVVYSETHSLKTNVNGLATLFIGNGLPIFGSFTFINWGYGHYYFKVEADPMGGTNYSITGISEIVSVPYALHSKTAESINLQGPSIILTNISDIQSNSASVNGIINGNGFLTDVLVEFGLTTNYGFSAIYGNGKIKGKSDIPVSIKLDGLNSNTTYHCRFYTQNAVDRIYTNDYSFTTSATYPTISTNTTYPTSSRTAISGGNITDDGGSQIVSRGVVWSSSTTPTIENNEGITNDGTGEGSFQSNISNLSANTLYYIRAYATNNIGTSYGDVISFTTLSTCFTSSILNNDTLNTEGNSISFHTIGSDSIITLNLTFDVPINQPTSGLIIIKELDSESIVQTVSLNTGTRSPDYKTLTFTFDLHSDQVSEIWNTYDFFTIEFSDTSLISNGSNCNFPSSKFPFNNFCITTTTHDFDGNKYHAVQVGTQIWLAENLITTHFNNGDEIGTTIPPTLNINEMISPIYQWSYSGNESHVPIFGRLYTWYSVTDVRGICPTGWHVPSNSEWITMANFLDGIGGKLKETGLTHWLHENVGATDIYGFKALPSGFRTELGDFNSIGNSTFWWTSTQYSFGGAYFIKLDGSSQSIFINSTFGKKCGNSVRCIKD